MFAKADRKEAAREFKERKPVPGIYGLVCHTTGRRWIDSSRNLNAVQNGQFFQLRQGLHRNKDLQAEWKSQGEESFEFVVLEALAEDTSPLLLNDLLAERKRVWGEEPRG
jgi:hypothetical protein